MKHATLPILCALCTLLATACANKSPATQNTAKKSCPQTFVAQPFAQLILTDELRNIQHTLSFAKVEALCKQDKEQATLLKLSFALRLDKPLPSKGRKKGHKTRLLVPLFAALTEDGETLASRQSQTLLASFDKKGRANISWLLSLPPAPPFESATTLYLGFEGNNLPLRTLLSKP